jgi:dienelactone hydrolase
VPEPRLLSNLLERTVGGTSQAISSPEAWPEKAKDIRERISRILGSFPDHIPTPAPEILEEIHEDGYVRRLVSYASESDERLPAYVLIPDRLEAPAPAMLCLHQTVAEGKKESVGLGEDKQKAYALHLVRRGYVCIAPDHLAAGERVAPGGDAYNTAAFYERHPGWSAVGKAIWDAQRAVDHLVSLPEVDPERVGVIGHSLGGHGAMFAAAFDERLKACVSNCGITTFAGNANRLAWARDQWYVYLPALRPFFLTNQRAPFDMHEFAALIAPRPFLTISSLTDTCMTVNADALQEFAGQVRNVYGLLGAREQFAWYYHDKGHSYPPEAQALAYAWLDGILRAPRKQ